MNAIREVLQITWQSMKALWEDLLILVLMNLATVSPIILPIFLTFGMAELWQAGYQTLAFVLAIVGLLPLLLLPPALAGLWNAANRVAEELAVHWSDYFEGFRRYSWKSLGLALISILILAILGANIWFYAPGNNPWEIDPGLSLAIRIFFAILTALWLVYQMYPMAMLLEQTDQRVRTALRNAGVLILTRPGFSILLALILAITIAISTYLVIPWFVLTFSFMALVCNKAVKHLLTPYREQAAQEADLETSAQEEKEFTDEESSQ
ncbi:MAG: hypothetical protein AB8I69_17045 [Anaerolineae bacterium]|jgi:hypothetical protein